jgi:hypothetical protein
MPLNLEGYDLEITSRHPLSDGDWDVERKISNSYFW